MIHTAILPWFSGPVLLLVYLAMICFLPITAFIFTLMDYREDCASSAITEKSGAWKVFVKMFINNDIMGIWYFLTGSGMIVMAGYVLLLGKPTIQRIIISLLLIPAGGLLAMFGEKKLLGFRK